MTGLRSGQNQRLQLEKELEIENEVIKASGSNKECVFIYNAVSLICKVRALSKSFLTNKQLFGSVLCKVR